MPQLTRDQVANQLSAYYSTHFGGTVWSLYDRSKRKYCIRGEGLPAHPDLQPLYPNGWGLLDWITPTEARQIIRQRKD